MENSPKCLHCANLITHEIGYSEWTITGCVFKCQVGCFKDKDWCYDDETPSDLISLKEISDRCKKYVEGEPEEHHIDCDIRDEGNCTCKE